MAARAFCLGVASAGMPGTCLLATHMLPGVGSFTPVVFAERSVLHRWLCCRVTAAATRLQAGVEWQGQHSSLLLRVAMGTTSSRLMTSVPQLSLFVLHQLSIPLHPTILFTRTLLKWLVFGCMDVQHHHEEAGCPGVLARPVRARECLRVRCTWRVAARYWLAAV